MERHRVTLIVDIDLDPVPGAFHELEDMRMRVERMLNEAVPWYKPEVKTVTDLMKEVE